MPESTARGIRYPLGVESPDWPGDFDRMAGDIDTLVPRIATGRLAITPSGRVTGQHVSFPNNMFTSEPIILASGHSGVPGNTFKKVSYSGASTSGATIWLDRTNDQRTTVSWMALEPGGGASYQGWQKPQYDGTSNTSARPSRYLNSLQTAIRAGLVRVDAGEVMFNPTANQPVSEYVQFKKGLFTGVPYVFTTMNTTVPGSTALGTSVLSLSAEGANIWFQRTSSTQTKVYWMAIQPTISERLWTPGGPADLPSIFEEFAGNAEDKIPRVDGGEIIISPTANTPTPHHIEFEPGLFTTDPQIFVTGGTSASTLQAVSVANQTPTGADVYVYRTNTTDTYVSWLAVQI